MYYFTFTFYFFELYKSEIVQVRECLYSLLFDPVSWRNKGKLAVQNNSASYTSKCVILLLLLAFSPWAGLAGTRAQSGDQYGSGSLHSRQVLRGSLQLLSPAIRCSHSRRQMPPRPQQREHS
jgi:hypothetical protein